MTKWRVESKESSGILKVKLLSSDSENICGWTTHQKYVYLQVDGHDP